MLFKLLQDDLNQALVGHEAKKVEALRYLIAQIKNLSIDLKRDPNDEEVVTCIKKQVKQLTDSILLFKQQNRGDLIKQYSDQVDIYQTYLPQELSDEELRKEIVLLLEKEKQKTDFNPKQFIGISVSNLKDRASPQRIIDCVRSLT